MFINVIKKTSPVFVASLVASLTAAISISAGAQATSGYPNKPIRYIVPFAPGGESDIGARFQAIVFKKKFGQELIIESKIGRAHV